MANVQDKQGGTLYVTHYPCPDCQKLIISSGIKRVVYAFYYKPVVDWLSQTDIEIVHLSDYIQEINLCKNDREDLLKILELFDEADNLKRLVDEGFSSRLDDIKEKLKK